MSDPIDDGGSAFGGKATAWKVIGDDDKARELGQALAREGGLKSLVISEEDSKKIEQLTLHLPSMSLRDWYIGQIVQGMIPELMNANTLDMPNTKEERDKRREKNLKEFVQYSYEIADALISCKRETEKTDGKK